MGSQYREQKLPFGHASKLLERPKLPEAREKSEHPEVWINGRHYQWEPGEESGIPPEALAVWAAYLEANS